MTSNKDKQKTEAAVQAFYQLFVLENLLKIHRKTPDMEFYF